LDRRLIDYLPQILRDVREFKAIYDDGQQPEIEALWRVFSDAMNDQFVTTATENGVRRWENILGIRPRGTDTLDARKFRILARLNEQLPYTYRTLENMLAALCGADGYAMDLQADIYTLSVKVGLIAKENVDDVSDLLAKVVPANMIIELSILFNTWLVIKSKTWGQIKTRTWRGVKEEV